MSAAAAPSREPRFLRACLREPVDATPIWLMRQAGRYMAEYRELRRTHGILELIKTPELACQVTLQPMDAFDLDAAIVFADILPPLEGMGLQLEFVKGEGPLIRNPVRDAASIRTLVVPDVEESLWFTLEAVKLARRELEGRGLPLIGFSGAPFTLACYAVEGGSSSTFGRAKALMMADPEAWHELMSKLSEMVGHYLLAQARAGAQVLQFFDSWVGILSRDDYREYVLPHSRRALELAGRAGVPLIHFGTGTGHMLDLIREAGGDVIGVDWRVDLVEAWNRVGPACAVQGNLDPSCLLAPWPEIEGRARRILDGVDGRAGHIFNLGHGVLQQTPPETVRRLVDFVHEYSRRPAA